MQTVGLSEAKARLSELLNRAQQGERLTITHRGIPVAELIASAAGERARVVTAIARIKVPRAKSKANVSVAELKAFREPGRC